MATSPRQADPIYYPEEDGKASESAKHYKQAMHLIQALDAFFAPRADVFVGGNLFVYYREGDPKRCFSPDVLVAFGVRPRPIEERGSFRMWEEGVGPTVIVELTSASTRQEDLVRKPQLYATLGVREYYLFDPLGEFLTPRLQGYHLNAAGQYERLPGATLDSPALGLQLVEHDGWLRLRDPSTGTLLPTPEEQQAALLASNAALAARTEALTASTAALTAAEAEIARLRAELAGRAAPPTAEAGGPGPG